MFIIRAAREKDPELCPIEDLRQCLTSVDYIVFHNIGIRRGLSNLNDEIFELIVSGDSDDMKLATDLCEKASQNDGNGVIDILCVYIHDNYCDYESRAESNNCDDNDKPTSYDGNCFAVSAYKYKTYAIKQPTVAFLVYGMDYAGGKLL